MRTTNWALVTLLAALTASAASPPGQTGDGQRDREGIYDPPRCPTITVSCPNVPGPDGSLTFTANVSGGDPNVTPTTRWTVSAGEISGGQGTFSITVDTSKAGGQFVTATVNVGGYPRRCPTLNSCTISPGLAPSSRKVDEYGDMDFSEEKARLDNLITELEKDPTAQGYVICYGRKGAAAAAARRRCERARDYLAPARASSRIVLAEGGSREESVVELWLVPSGALPPEVKPGTEQPE
jgi:hypothetical protein